MKMEIQEPSSCCKYCMSFRAVNRKKRSAGKISAQPHTILCIQFLDRENTDKNNTLPLGKQICLTIELGYAEILPNSGLVCHLLVDTFTSFCLKCWLSE